MNATPQSIHYAELQPGSELPGFRIRGEIRGSAGQFTGRVKSPSEENASLGGVHDPEGAARFGYRGALVPGPTIWGYVHRVMRSYFGASWLRCGELSITISSPIYDQQFATAGAVVTQRSDSRIDFDVWVDNEVGERCVRGTAAFLLSGMLGAPDRPDYVIRPEDVVNNPSWPRGELPVGVPTTPVTLVLSTENSMQRADEEGAGDDWLYTKFVHPRVFLLQSFQVKVERPPSDAPQHQRRGGIHVGSEVSWFKLAPVDREYSFYGTYIDAFDTRNGNRWGKKEVIAIDDEGDIVFRTRNTFIFLPKEKPLEKDEGNL